MKFTRSNMSKKSFKQTYFKSMQILINMIKSLNVISQGNAK